MVLGGISFFPHGAMILDPQKEDIPLAAIDLHHQCNEAAKLIVDLAPSVIILVTPHGLSSSHSLNVYQNSSFRGNAGWFGHWEEFCVECTNADDSLTQSIIDNLTKAGVVCEGIAAFSRGAVGPLAWGEAVPLWFHRELLDRGTRVVVLSVPQRRLTDTMNYCENEALEVGRYISRLCMTSGDRQGLLASERVCLLVSGDLSHVHGCPPTTPAIYQGHPSLGEDRELAQSFDSHLVEQWAKKVFTDGKITESIVNDAKGQLLQSSIVREKVVDAKLCGFAGLCVIQGCLEELVVLSEKGNIQTSGKVFGYAAPTYYGMLVASMKIE